MKPQKVGELLRNRTALAETGAAYAAARQAVEETVSNQELTPEAEGKSLRARFTDLWNSLDLVATEQRYTHEDGSLMWATTPAKKVEFEIGGGTADYSVFFILKSLNGTDLDIQAMLLASSDQSEIAGANPDDILEQVSLSDVETERPLIAYNGVIIGLGSVEWTAKAYFESAELISPVR